MASHRARNGLGPPVLKPGTRIGDRYVIVRPLGEGGMGQVFEVEHEAIGRHLALKVLNINPLTDEVLRRFQREARALGRMATPRVAQVTDFDVEPGVGPFYVMELLDGETLEQRLEREHHLPVDQAIPIAIELCEALAEVHASGVIHRDLKPSNVGLVRSGPVRIKLLDFGLAAAIDSAVLERITRSQEVVGSLPYMAPERFYNAPLTHSIDLYSLGVMLYEMLSGVLPYQGLSAAILINQHLNEPPPPFSKVAPGMGIPASLEVIAARLLHKDPAQRFLSAADVSRALQEAVLESPAKTLADVAIASTVFADPAEGMAAGPVPDAEELSEDRLATVEASVPEHVPEQLEPRGPSSATQKPSHGGIPTSVVPDGVPREAWPRPIVTTVVAEGASASQPYTYPQPVAAPPPRQQGWISEPVPPTTYGPPPPASRGWWNPRWNRIAAVFAAGVIGSTLAAILAFILFSGGDSTDVGPPSPAATTPSPLSAPSAPAPPPVPAASGFSPDVGLRSSQVAPPVVGPGAPFPVAPRSVDGAGPATMIAGGPPDAGARARPQTDAGPASVAPPRAPRAGTSPPYSPPPRTKTNVPWNGEIIEAPDR